MQDIRFLSTNWLGSAYRVTIYSLLSTCSIATFHQSSYCTAHPRATTAACLQADSRFRLRKAHLPLTDLTEGGLPKAIFRCHYLLSTTRLLLSICQSYLLVEVEIGFQYGYWRYAGHSQPSVSHPIVCGGSCGGVNGLIVATAVSVMSMTLQLKNYRKPALQRAVVRIMVMYVFITLVIT